ncbi:MAG: glycosyltransferase family 2 protein, partial [Chromatiaceae bacterium]|nr:glycosyltransferase family 2 protein [Chromatiaceae bacterium]
MRRSAENPQGAVNKPETLSVVIPLYNEQENVETLVHRVHEGLANCELRWELICVDDGSSDATWNNLLGSVERHGAHVKAVRLSRNFGQTAAMQAGIDAARGELIATLDGDLQNDPADIPRMLRELIERDLDLLQGWRKSRKDALLMRKIPSRIANKLIAKVTGVALNDYGCSLKVYRASMIKKIRLFGEMHRFIPVWAATVTSPSRIGETEVSHQARVAGKSKYGISRTFRVLLDLLAMFFFLRYRARPGHFFGSIGLALGALGGAIMSYLMVVKFGFGESIGERPLLLVGILCLIASAQFLTTGVLAELLARTFFESSRKQAYSLCDDA